MLGVYESRILVCLLHDDDSMLGGCRHVHVVDAGASSSNQLQPSERTCRYDVGRHLGRRPHDQSVVFLVTSRQIAIARRAHAHMMQHIFHN